MDNLSYLAKFLAGLVGANHPVRFAFALALSRGIYEVVQGLSLAYPESTGTRILQGLSWSGWIGLTFAATFLWVLLRPMNEGDRRLLTIIDHALHAGKFSDPEKRHFYRSVIARCVSLAGTPTVTVAQAEAIAAEAVEEIRDANQGS